MPDELTEPGRATPARASSFLIENLLAAEAKGAGSGAQGGGGREEEEDDDDDPEDEDAERARRRRLQRRRQLRAGSGPSAEARARPLLGPGALGLGPRPPPGPGPPYALGCGGAARWYSRSHGGYGGGLSPDSEWGVGRGGPGGGARLLPIAFAPGLWVRWRPFWAALLLCLWWALWARVESPWVSRFGGPFCRARSPTQGEALAGSGFGPEPWESSLGTGDSSKEEERKGG